MRTISASDAKTHLPRLLGDVEHGETIVITRHGRAIARLVPEADGRRADVAEVISELRAFRRSLPPMSREELLASRHAGHKY